MIKMICAHTKEIDNIDIAINDVLSQLKIKDNILKNSIGIVSCYSDFAQTSVLKAVCKALPFTTVGMNTVASGTSNCCGQVMLSVSVITSDDVSFTTMLSDNMNNKHENIVSFCKNAKTQIQKETKMILAFVPNNPKSSIISETILSLIGEGVDIPVFGGIATSYDNMESAGVIFNGNLYDDQLVLALIDGNFNPRFVFSDISSQKTAKERWLITETRENLIIKINGMSFTDFICSISDSGSLLDKECFNIIPFWFDFKGANELIARAITAVTDDGVGVCSGKIPSGITMSIGNISKKVIVETAENVFEKISQIKEIHGVLLFSEKGKFFALGVDWGGEIKTLKNLFQNIPFHFMYSMGEYCSVYSEGRENGFRNYSTVGLVF